MLWGDHTHQNVREERNLYLYLYLKHRNVMSLSKKTRHVTGKSIKLKLSSLWCYCRMDLLKLALAWKSRFLIF